MNHDHNNNKNDDSNNNNRNNNNKDWYVTPNRFSDLQKKRLSIRGIGKR